MTSETSRPTQREAALHYAGRGWEVFPANPRTKAPLTENGMKDATTDAEQIEQWWKQHPDALVACRIPPDQVVLDIDPRHGGDTTWTELQNAYATIMSARVHRSGRGDGGAHHWFQRPAGKLSAKKLHEWARNNGVGQDVGNGKWTSGIDILHHDHRYSILPPSPHPDTGKPYQWAHKDDPLDMPAFLADLITADPEPEPAPPRPTLPTGDSIADWLSRTATWVDILSPHGWQIVHGDGDSDGSKWKHPSATAASSASIKHGCLFVYSPNTHFPETEQGDANGITRFRAWATLNYAGDLSTAARAALEMRDGPRPADVNLSELIAAPPPTSTGGVNLPDEFWQSRPVLSHVRQAAHNRRRSADAVLLAVIARTAALIPPTVVLPAVVGSRASLNFLAGIAASSGGGKSTAVDVARELVPIDRSDVVADVPPGSGEGLTELFFEMVSEEGPDGKQRKVKRKTKNGALIYLDEGQALGEMGSRKGATLLPTLRSAWSGQTLGQSNATQETHRVLKAHSYRMSIVVGFQLEYVADLIADAGGGTPQRFVFASATDPTIPDRRPTWPGELHFDIPTMISTGTEVEIDDPVIDEIDRHALAVSRGEIVPDPLDSHANLVRMKVAALLAFLDGSRLEVTEDDWRLAGMVMRTSNAVRSVAIEHSRLEQRRSDEAYAYRLARREEIIGESAETKAMVSGAKSMARKVHDETTETPCNRTVLHHAASGRARKVASVDSMIDYAVEQGWILRVGDEFSPGESRPT